MTAPNPPSNSEPTTPAPSPTAPPSGAAAPEQWRAGTGRYAGMTAEQILGIAEGLAVVAERFNQPVPQAPPDPVDRFSLDDESYVQGKEVKQILRQVLNQAPPQDYGARQLAAQSVYGLLKLQYPEEFRKWEPEIRAEASKLPLDYWNLDNLTTIIRIVRGNHVDEIAAEKAQRLVDESHPTIRSGTGGSGSVPRENLTLEAEGIPAEWKAAAKAQGLTEAQVREFCELAGITERQYYQDLMKWGKAGVIHG